MKETAGNRGNLQAKKTGGRLSWKGSGGGVLPTRLRRKEPLLWLKEERAKEVKNVFQVLNRA